MSNHLLNDPPRLGAWLKRQREKRLLTLHEAADEAGISYNRLWQMEHGQVGPTTQLGTLARVLALYGRQLTFGVVPGAATKEETK